VESFETHFFKNKRLIFENIFQHSVTHLDDAPLTKRGTFGTPAYAVALNISENPLSNLL
jgi:hypothetical protein